MTLDIRTFETHEEKVQQDPFFKPEYQGFYRLGVKSIDPEENLAQNVKYLTEAFRQIARIGPTDPGTLALKLNPIGYNDELYFETVIASLWEQRVEGNGFTLRLRYDTTGHEEEFPAGLSMAATGVQARDGVFSTIPGLNLKILFPEFYPPDTEKIPIKFWDLKETVGFQLQAPVADNYRYEFGLFYGEGSGLVEFLRKVTGIPEPRFISIRASEKMEYSHRDFAHRDRHPENPTKDIELEIGV